MKPKDAATQNFHLGLKPLFLFEMPIGEGSGQDHESTSQWTGMFLSQIGHVMKIHPIPGPDHHQRRGNDGDTASAI